MFKTGAMILKLFFIVVAGTLLAGCVDLTNTEAEADRKLRGDEAFDPNITPSPFPKDILGVTDAPQPQETPMKADYPKKTPVPATTATITVGAGEITIKLMSESAPNSVANFAEKARAGFYNGLKFHRVEDWVIQGGDPLGTGTGGGTQPSEFSQVPFKEGSVGIARGGDRAVSNDAQFFICTKDCSWLSGDYTLIGEVTEGMEVAMQVKIGEVISRVVVE